MKKILFILCIISTTAFADNYAFVDQSGNVQNIVEWDGVSDYRPCPDKTNACLIKDPNNPPQVARGWTYDGSAFAPPATPPQQDPPAQ